MPPPATRTIRHRLSTASAAAAVLLIDVWSPRFLQVSAAQPAGHPPKPELVLKLSDETTLSLNRLTVTYGTKVRARGRAPDLLPPGNAARVGLIGTAPAGQNNDDGNLNYDRGDSVSTAFKGILDLELRHGNDLRAFVRARAWDDRAQRRNAVPHGNIPNNFVANTSLTDAGFSRYGQFSNAVLMDAYAEGTLRPAGQPLMLRLGAQAIPWGMMETSILGGLDQVNAIDYAARFRAGALPRDEGYVPAPAAFARLGTRETTALEAFYMLRFRPNELAGCGTFFALADYVTPGCGLVMAQPAALSDAAALAAGIVARRAPDVKPPHSGQYGIAAIHTSPVGRFGVYYANYHSRRFAPTAIKSTRTAFGGVPLIPGDPGSENVRYLIEYPEDVRMLGLTWGAVLPAGAPGGTGISAEYTYRPNQSVLLNSIDLFNAFASNVAPTPLRADAIATAPGAPYPGYDRRQVSQLNLRVRHPFPEEPRERLSLAAEVGFRYIHDLPDVNVRRYGRSDIYGLGPINGVCPAGASARQCSTDGYVSAFSWGYRVRAARRFPNVLDGLDLVPSIAFSHDVKGWAHDIVFIEGRKAASFAVRADFRRSFFVEAAWVPIWGGEYNFLRDRDYYTVFGGITF
jgi:hypothetical protein